PESAIGERAQAARTRLGLNQLEGAVRIGISGQGYSRLERGLMTPRLATFLQFCDVLGVEPDDLLQARQGPRLRNDAMSPELRQLVSVLEHADATVIKRVTEVARWLLVGPAPRKPASSPSKRKARAPRGQRRPRRRT